MSNPRWRPLTEGRPILLPLGVLALAIALLFPAAVLLVLLAAGAVMLAFRDPERDIARRPDVALAPADGRVIHVDRVWDPYWQAELIEIAIFLSLGDVHIQRAPLDGEVVAQHRRAGGYRPAMGRAATHGNNQVATYMRTTAGPCVVTQISGLVARRIVSWAGPGTRLAQGERLGMIKFGSQVTLRLPATAVVVADVGDRVHAGLTPVAEMVEGETAAPELPHSVKCWRSYPYRPGDTNSDRPTRGYGLIGPEHHRRQAGEHESQRLTNGP